MGDYPLFGLLLLLPWGGVALALLLLILVGLIAHF